MKKMIRYVSPKTTSQSQSIPGREIDMTRNYAGAYAFKADIWTRLNRFLTIGSEGGTYYAAEGQVTIDNMQAVQECVEQNGLRVVHETVAISKAGRAPKNDQAILVLAYCLKKGDLHTRRAAELAVNDVCRIGTHIFQLAEAIEAFGGWGSITTRAIANWYNSRRLDQVAFQAIKYQSRGGTEILNKVSDRVVPGSLSGTRQKRFVKIDTKWSHGDLLKLSHVMRNRPGEMIDPDRYNLYGWILDHSKPSEGLPRIIEGFQKIQNKTDAKVAANLIRDYRLPREVVPSELLNSTEIWEALLEDMPMTAMIRNLGKMSSIGLLDPMSEWTHKITDQLRDTERLHKARIHPINVLVALKTYSQGHGVRGSLIWNVNQQIINGLDDAFYGSFENIDPINKRVLVAIDKSGSMQNSASNTILTAQECAAVMAMVTVKKSDQYYVVAYDADNSYWNKPGHKGLVDLQIDPRQRLDDILRKLPADGGATDASLPIRWATENKIKFDAICLYSDGESWAGHTHTSQAINGYRQKSGLKVKFATCDTVASHTQLVDNLDELGFYCAGFDEQAPSLIQNFISD